MALILRFIWFISILWGCSGLWYKAQISWLNWFIHTCWGYIVDYGIWPQLIWFIYLSGNMMYHGLPSHIPRRAIVDYGLWPQLYGQVGSYYTLVGI